MACRSSSQPLPFLWLISHQGPTIPPPKYLWNPPLLFSFPSEASHLILSLPEPLTSSCRMIHFTRRASHRELVIDSEGTSSPPGLRHDLCSIWKGLLYPACLTHSHLSIKNHPTLHIIRKMFLDLPTYFLPEIRFPSLQHEGHPPLLTLSLGADQSFPPQMLS